MLKYINEIVTSINAGWGDYKLILDGVRAYECIHCGEKIYDKDEVHMIQELSRNLGALSKEKRPDILNLKEVAEILRVSNQTIYNMIRDGRLKAVKLGREWRFLRKDIESLLGGKEILAARDLVEKKAETC
ncbi:MAG: helix-turn-helix domain-containing protein [Clostridiaceae bacterium]|nr:helix-turn-helix domain-containing protein [Clostridiaceae bacterium]